MKICIFSETFLPIIGGLQYEVKWLSEELANQGLKIYLLSYTNGKKYIKKQKNGFPRFIQLQKNGSIPMFFEIYKVIKTINPDIIHVHGARLVSFLISILKTLKLINRPLIITSHGDDIMVLKEINYGLRLDRMGFFIVPYSLKHCDKHVIVGKGMMPHAIDAGSQKSKIALINNGIPLQECTISENFLNNVKKRYNIAPDDTILLSLSGMRPLKGLEYLIRAMPQILERNKKTKLFLACKGGGYEIYLKELVKKLDLENNVHFIGFVKGRTKIALIRLCDIFCKPSLLEACSIAILEAMKEGKVVVASIPGGIDIISHGINGILTKTKNSSDIAEKINYILENKRLRQLIESQTKIHIQNYDIRKIAENYIRLYIGLLNNKN